MFPISIEGEVEIAQLRVEDTEHVLVDLTAQLASLRATAIERAGDVVTFRGGILRFVSNWNLLVPVTHGRVEVIGSAGRIRYTFSCAQLLVLVTFVSAALGLFAGYGSGGPRIGLASVLITSTAWLWLFGMNYAVARFRLRRFVRGLAPAPST